MPSSAGGLYVRGTHVTMTASTISNNEGEGFAGLWILGHGAADLTNETIAGNATYTARFHETGDRWGASRFPWWLRKMGVRDEHIEDATQDLSVAIGLELSTIPAGHEAAQHELIRLASRIACRRKRECTNA